MPIFFQQPVTDTTRLGVWKIEETEDFFKGNVPLHRDVTHPHKRLQHLAGRFLLQFLFPDFPYDLIKIADTRKPFLPDEQYHFSISHCGDFAAAIVSSDKRVGIDIEIPEERIGSIAHKFVGEKEKKVFSIQPSLPDFLLLTRIWSIKESIFKWYGDGGVDFKKHIHLLEQRTKEETVRCLFVKTNVELEVHYRQFEQICLTWVVS